MGKNVEKMWKKMLKTLRKKCEQKSGKLFLYKKYVENIFYSHDLSKVFTMFSTRFYSLLNSWISTFSTDPITTTTNNLIRKEF